MKRFFSLILLCLACNVAFSQDAVLMAPSHQRSAVFLAPTHNKNTEGETIPLTIKRWAKSLNCNYMTDVWSWQIHCDLFDKANYVFDFYVVVDELEYGVNYTLEDMDDSYSYGSYGQTIIEYSSVNLLLTRDANMQDCVDITVKDEKGNAYKLTYRPAPLPEVFEDVYVTFNGASFVDERDNKFHGYFHFDGVTDSLECTLSSTSDHILGTIAPEDVLLKNYVPYTYMTIVPKQGYPETVEIGKAENVQITAGKEEGDYTCTATLYGYNGKCYHVTLNHATPEAKNDTTLEFKNLVVGDGMYEQWGVMQYVGHTDEYRTEILLYYDGTKGEYSGQKVANVYLYDCLAEKEVLLYKYGPVTLTGAGRGEDVRCDAIGVDSTVYHIWIHHVKPEKTRDENISCTMAKLKDYTSDADMHCFQLLGYNEDRSRLVSVTVNANSVSGIYNASKMRTDYTYVVDNPDDATALRYTMEDASVMVDYNKKSKTATVSGVMLCSNPNTVKDVPYYTFTMTAKLDEGLQYDNDHEGFEGEFTSDDIIWNTENLDRNHIVTIQALNAKGTGIYMDFFVSEKDPDIIIPEGEYTIDHSENPFTVSASNGVDSKGQISYSFVGTTDGDIDHIKSPLWFMREGTVKVSKINGKAHIEVDAINSYEQPVKAVLGEGVAYDTEHLKAESYEIATRGDTTEYKMSSSDDNYQFDITLKGNEVVYDKTHVVVKRDMQTLSFREASFTRTLTENRKETIKFTATALDNTKFGITYSGYLPKSEETITLTKGTFEDFTIDNGVWQIYGTTENNLWTPSISIYSYSIAGQYKLRDVFEEYTSITKNDEEGRSLAVYKPLELNVTMTYDKTTRIAHLTGEYIGYNTNDVTDVVLFHLDLMAEVPMPKPLDYDASEDNPFNATFAWDDIDWNTEYFERAGLVYMQVQNEKRQILYFGFIASRIDPVTILPEGTYMVNGSFLPFTVIPSEGATSGGINASFAGQLSEDGKMNVPLWFVRDGTIRLTMDDSNNIIMTIEAYNSCGSAINATVSGEIKTGIPNIKSAEEVKSKKFLRNGRLLIKKGNNVYDVLGRKVE